MSDPAYSNAPAHTSGSRSNGLAIAALITGIIALLLSWIPLINIIAFILAIAAVITGFIGMGKAKQPDVGGKGMALTGLITGVLAIIIGIGLYTFLASVLNDPAVQEQIEQIEEQQNTG